MDMKNQLMRRCGFTLLVVYGLWAGIGEVWAAQSRSTSGAARSTGGASRGNTGGASRGSTGSSGRSGSSSSASSSATAMGEATVTSDPETRRLIVVTDDETSQYISQVISNLDRPKPQVLIKVVFIEVTHNNGSDIGIEGSFNNTNLLGGASWLNGLWHTNFNVFGNTNVTQSGAQLNTSVTRLISPDNMNAISTNATMFGGTSFGLPSMGSPNGLYALAGENYTVVLRAIATAGKLEILSRNNQRATINLGQSVPLVTNTRFDTFGNQINTVSYQSVGVNLNVTPFITADGLVEMIVQPEISALAERSQWVPISGGALAPVINSRSADTVVVVPDRQTVIIGGLMQSEKGESVTKIPLLGDIPWIGGLFRHTIKNVSKTELLIFLTPNIVTQPTQLASLTATERANSQALQTVEADLDRFLDNLPVKGVTPAKKKVPK